VKVAGQFGFRHAELRHTAMITPRQLSAGP
jgi:hypothetical protein